MLVFLILSSGGVDQRRGVDVFLFAHCFAEIVGCKIHILFLETRLISSSVLSEKNIQFSYNTNYSAMAILLREPK